MGMRTTWTGSLQKLDDALTLFENGQNVVGDSVEATQDTGILDVALQQLKQYPAAAAPGTFKDTATPAQIRAVMAKLRAKGDYVPGGSYKRTGGYADRMFIQVEVDNAVAKIIMGNTGTIGKFIGGSFAKDVNAAARFQQPFHDITGWLKNAETANAAFQLINEDVRENVFIIVGEMGTPQFKRRGYTQSTRRRK